MDNMDPQMLKGIVVVLLLHLIAGQEDYGYALVVRLREAGFEGMAEGTVYPALSRLEKSGHIESYLVPSERGPARKYYRITASGRSELAEGTDSWTHLAARVTGLLKGNLS